MNISNLVLNWILNWIIFGPDSMFDWIIETYRPGLLGSEVLNPCSTNLFLNSFWKILIQNPPKILLPGLCSPSIMHWLNHKTTRPRFYCILTVFHCVRDFIPFMQSFCKDHCLMHLSKIVRGKTTIRSRNFWTKPNQASFRTKGLTKCDRNHLLILMNYFRPGWGGQDGSWKPARPSKGESCQGQQGATFEIFWVHIYQPFTTVESWFCEENWFVSYPE